MEKIFVVISFVCSLFISGFLQAQNNTQSEEIVIRNNGVKEMNLNIKIKGDRIIVNGKPLSEFKDNHITINKRKTIIQDANNSKLFNLGQDGIWGFSNSTINQGYNAQNATIKPFLGVTTEKKNNGVLVKLVAKGSPAEKAGLKKNDLITKVDSFEVTNIGTLSQVIFTKNPGDIVKIYYKRAGKVYSRKIKLVEIKNDNAVGYSSNGLYGGNVQSFNMPSVEMRGNEPVSGFQPGIAGRGNEYNPLINDATIMAPQQQKLGIKIQDTEQGGCVRIIVVEPGSIAEKAGLFCGDLIKEIDDKIINNTDDARIQLRPQEGKTTYKVKVQRYGNDFYIEINFPQKLKMADL